MALPEDQFEVLKLWRGNLGKSYSRNALVYLLRRAGHNDLAENLFDILAALEGDLAIANDSRLEGDPYLLSSVKKFGNYMDPQVIYRLDKRGWRYMRRRRWLNLYYDFQDRMRIWRQTRAAKQTAEV